MHAVAQTIDLFPDYGIRAPQQFEILSGDLANDAHREARSGERLALHNFSRETERTPDFADFVLEEIA